MLRDIEDNDFSAAGVIRLTPGEAALVVIDKAKAELAENDESIDPVICGVIGPDPEVRERAAEYEGIDEYDVVFLSSKDHPRPPWDIALTENGGICEICGKPVGNPYLDGIMWATTHGLEELYNHLDFELVVSMPEQYACQILNMLGARVQSGEVFSDGQTLNDVLQHYPVKIKRMDSYGADKLRIIVPDRNGLWPEDAGCEYPYSLQIMSMKALENATYKPHEH